MRIGRVRQLAAARSVLAARAVARGLEHARTVFGVDPSSLVVVVPSMTVCELSYPEGDGSGPRCDDEPPGPRRSFDGVRLVESFDPDVDHVRIASRARPGVSVLVSLDGLATVRIGP